MIALAPAAHAAFEGQYIGQAKIAYSGTLNQGPNSAGLVSFTVRADGTVVEIGNDLIGTIDSGGTITWQQPNAFSFTTGTVAGNILTASAATTANGLTITRSVEANLSGAQFPPGNSFAGQLTDLNPINGYGGINDIKFVNGGFIAVGGSGGIVRSDDSLTWRRASSPTAKPVNTVAYGNGTYLCGGDSGTLFTSPDGVTWTQRVSPFVFGGSTTISNITDATFGSGKFLITSHLGKGATSSDGIAWTEVGASGGTFEKVEFLNGQFVKYYQSSLQYSADGQAWSTAINPNVGVIYDVTYGNGKWVAAGNTRISVSPDGSTWTPAYTGNTKVLEFGNGRFIARTAGSSGTQLYSDDGATWTLASSSLQSSVVDCAYGNGRYVMAGGDLIGSPDGISWGRLKRNRLVLSAVDFKGANSGNPTLYFESMIQTDFNNVRTLMDVNVRTGGSVSEEYFAGDGGKFFLSRGSNPKQYLDLNTTENLHTIITPYGSLRGGFVAGGGGVIRRFVASGLLNSETYSSLEIASPTTRTLRYGMRRAEDWLTFIVGDGGVIVKISDPQGLSPVASLDASGTTEDLRFVGRVSNGGFPALNADVAVGANGTILVRNDTTGAWSSRTSGTAETLIGMAWVPPNFVAVSEDGGVVISPDLNTWTAAPRMVPPGKITRFYNGSGAIPPIALGEAGFYAYAYANSGSVRFQEGVNSLTGAYFTAGSQASSVAFGNGKYVVVGGTYSSASDNGKTWKNAVTGATFNAVAFGEGKFVAVGGPSSETASNDRIYSSSDGLLWTKATMPALNRPLNSVTYGSGKFIASGKRGVVMASDDGVEWTQVAGDLASSDTVVSLAHNNGNFVGVGGGAIVHSSDSGVTFVTRGTAGASGLSSVAWGAGTFVAVGSAGNTIRSTNGTSWSRTQVPANQSSTGSAPVFNQVAYANNHFIATTSSGQAYISTGGVSWQEKYTGVSRVFTGSTVANGLVLFVGAGEITGIAVEDNSPYVTSQPQGGTVNAGTTLNLSVTVSGGNPLTYQWTLNGAVLANGGTVTGTGTSTLTINNITAAFSGTYQVTVTNPDGSRTSHQATVNVEGTAVTGYDAWKEGFTFPAGKDQPLDDADDDGVQNLIEFVTGSDPVQPGPGYLPSIAFASGTQLGGTTDPAKTYFTFRARVRKDRPGITLIPQSGSTIADLLLPGASDLVGQAGPPVDDPNHGEFEFITYYHKVAFEDSTSGKAFMRLGVSL